MYSCEYSNQGIFFFERPIKRANVINRDNQHIETKERKRERKKKKKRGGGGEKGAAFSAPLFRLFAVDFPLLFRIHKPATHECAPDLIPAVADAPPPPPPPPLSISGR